MNTPDFSLEDYPFLNLIEVSNIPCCAGSVYIAAACCVPPLETSGSGCEPGCCATEQADSQSTTRYV